MRKDGSVMSVGVRIMVKMTMMMTTMTRVMMAQTSVVMKMLILELRRQ